MKFQPSARTLVTAIQTQVADIQQRLPLTKSSYSVVVPATDTFNHTDVNVSDSLSHTFSAQRMLMIESWDSFDIDIQQNSQTVTLRCNNLFVAHAGATVTVRGLGPTLTRITCIYS